MYGKNKICWSATLTLHNLTILEKEHTHDAMLESTKKISFEVHMGCKTAVICRVTVY